MMKLQNIGILFFIVLIFQISCNSTEQSNTHGTAEIKFQHTEFDFGTIQMGENVVHDFLFTNTGDGDLYIKKIDTDCGCTAAKFNRNAIKPNEESTIETVFSSNGFPGFQTKKITVFTNAKNDSIVLTLSAVVDYKLIRNNSIN